MPTAERWTSSALAFMPVPTEELLDKEEEESAAIADEETENGGVSLESPNGQYAEPTDDEENLQSFPQERQAFIKEKLDKWCEELGYKDTTVKMMLDYPDYSNDIIQPNVASLHAPISIAYSKRKNVTPQLFGERKYNKITP